MKEAQINIQGNLKAIDFHIKEIVRLLEFVEVGDFELEAIKIRKEFLRWNKLLSKAIIV